MIDDEVRERDAFRRRLRRVFDPRHPAILLEKELVAWEERRGVPVWAHAEEDKIEDRVARGVFHGEFPDQFLLVGIGKLVEVVEVVRVNRVDVLCRDGNFGIEYVAAELVV